MSHKNDNDDILDVEIIDIRPPQRKRTGESLIYDKGKIQCGNEIDDLEMIDVCPLPPNDRLRLFNKQKKMKDDDDDDV